jgi:uncharacterized membrane protein
MLSSSAATQLRSYVKDEMSESSSLEERVRELEARMAELEQAVKPGRSPSAAPPAPRSARLSWDALVDSGEGWLARVGVALLVVGLILLFRYAADRGWLTPEMRVAMGLALGAGLLIGGVFLFRERRLYRQILAGGGITILFITGLAASELYHLISGLAALVFFAAVAATAFTIAARQQESIIATVGSVGALLPPAFLLEDTTRGVVLWLYMALIIAGSGTLFSLRNWERPLAFGAVISVAALFHPVPADRPYVQIAALIACAVCWIAYAALPLIRARTRVRDTPLLSPELLVLLPTVITIGLAAVVEAFIVRHGYGFEATAGIGAAALAVLAVWLGKFCERSPYPSFQWHGDSYRINAYSAAVLASAASLAAASVAALAHPWFYVSVAVVALICMWLSDRIEADILRPLAHFLFAGIAAAFTAVAAVALSRPAFDRYAIAFAVASGVAALTALQLERRDDRVAYFIGIYFIMHVLLASELSAVKGAPWLASVAYGVVGSGLLLFGLQRADRALQRAGMVSLALLVGRLFLYDLAQVDVGVRIVLFLVFGFAFLGLSYLVRDRT